MIILHVYSKQCSKVKCINVQSCFHNLDLSQTTLVLILSVSTERTAKFMETFKNLLCIMVVSFVILAHPAVVQGANTTLPFTHLGRGPIRMENNWHFKHKSYFMEQNMREKIGKC